MRAAPFLLLAPLLLVAVPTGSAVAQTHLSVAPVQLDPGQVRELDVETGEGPWIAGMVFIVDVQFFNEPRNLQVDLVLGESDVVETWILNDVANHVSGRIPKADGPYHVRLTNQADAQTQFLFYFDQDCNCTMKPVPIRDGWVVFAYDLKKGHKYEIGFPLVAGWSVDGVLATRETVSSHYPEDFKVVGHAQEEGPHWLNFTVAPTADAKHYVFVTVLQGSPVVPDGRTFVSLTPLLTDKGGKSPAPAVAGIVALAVAVFLRGRR